MRRPALFAVATLLIALAAPQVSAAARASLTVVTSRIAPDLCAITMSAAGLDASTTYHYELFAIDGGGTKTSRASGVAALDGSTWEAFAGEYAPESDKSLYPKWELKVYADTLGGTVVASKVARSRCVAPAAP